MKTLDVICGTCLDCKGLGFIEDKLCEGCDGAGRVVIPFAKTYRKSAVRIVAELALAMAVIILVVIAIVSL